MTFVESVSICTEKIVQFDGRASRSEYWWFFLFVALFFFTVAAFLPSETRSNLSKDSISFLSICSQCMLFSVSIRRLHDIGLSGWWYCLSLVTYLQPILFILLLKRGDSEENQYGEPNNN